MGQRSQIEQLFQRNPTFIRRPGIVGELVNAAAVPLFRISGGDIRAGIYGKITTGIGANNTTVQLRITPTGGATQALSAASGNLTGLVANTVLVPTGAVAVAITIEVTFGVAVGYMLTNQWILLPGVIDILVGGATTTVGAIAWTLIYQPADSNVTLTVL